MNPVSPLDRPASIPLVRRLFATGALTADETTDIERQIRRDLPWRLWLDRALLILGILLIISGIGYFFAHNWNHLTDNDKLWLAAGSVFLALIGATWGSIDRFPGKLLLLAASMLTGVFLGVYAQVYQTGQTGFEAFSLWAFLIFPWVTLGRFIPLWLFWLMLLNAALGFYWSPDLDSLDLFDNTELFRHQSYSLVALNLAALVAREFAGRAEVPWIDRNWSALVLLAATVFPLTVVTSSEILHTWDSVPNYGAAIFAFIGFAVFDVLVAIYYGRVRYSLPALALMSLGACIVLTFLAIRLIIDDHHGDEAGSWFMMGVIILAIFGGGVWYLRRQRAAHHD